MTAPLVSTTDRPYQLLPPLDEQQRHILRQSIEENGVLEPVVFDEEGEILDGHHRVEIAEELGIDYPRRVIDDLDRSGKHMYALTVNVARRQLDQSTRGSLVAQMRIRGMSIREIAKTVGVSRETVRRDLAGDTSVSPEKVTGADGKSYAASRPTPEAAHPSWPTEAELKPWESLAPMAERIAESMELIADDPRDRTHGAEFESYDAAEPERKPTTTQTPGPAAAPTVPVAGPGSTSPESEIRPATAESAADGAGPASPAAPASPVDSDAKRALDDAIAQDSARRAAIKNLTTALTMLTPISIKPAELAKSYAWVLDEFEQRDLDRAAETMAAIAAMKRGM